MLSTPWTDRRGRAERIATQAWDHLVSAVESAGDTARSAAGGAEDKVGSARDEAWRRASDAFDALAGRRPHRPWLLILGAGLVGAAIGWAAGTAARNAITRDNEDQIEIVEADAERRSSTLA
ncbi:hypothetical protein [Phytohabitans aurantiacus]|uniref:YtxH domain-containing protein n=1 Tax=Phytohabitans aurantiacus TaxID=3016789 RepID=A0ABQ5QZK2_9ACTN|nr:hypothetical protein [Phytohabitans aurantiacus]GLH99051.1 hypothetical protein Pa4123_43260 [Phytohabitans aurantiacus]